MQNGNQIAKELGITRQTVSQLLKSALKKIYKKTLELKIATSPFDAANIIMIMLNVNKGDLKDIKGFYNLFPSSIKKEIEMDAKNIYKW